MKNSDRVEGQTFVMSHSELELTPCVGSPYITRYQHKSDTSCCRLASPSEPCVRWGGGGGGVGGGRGGEESFSDEGRRSIMRCHGERQALTAPLQYRRIFPDGVRMMTDILFLVLRMRGRERVRESESESESERERER